MPGETEIENGTQEIVAEVKKEPEVAAEIKKEIVVPVKPEVVAEVEQKTPETAPQEQQDVEVVQPEQEQVAPQIEQNQVPVTPLVEQNQVPVAPQVEQIQVPEVVKQEEPPSAPIIQQNGTPAKKQEPIIEPPIQPTIQQNGVVPKKSSTMSTSMDTEAVRAAYDDVRSDNTETQWAVLKFQGSKIVVSATGASFDKFKEQFGENERVFGYIRITTGDEMSKRQKFILVTWVGPSVSVLQRAKMSTDKSVVKNVISNFAVELQVENTSEIDLGHFVDALIKAGGANYGTGVREI